MVLRKIYHAIQDSLHEGNKVLPSQEHELESRTRLLRLLQKEFVRLLAFSCFIVSSGNPRRNTYRPSSLLQRGDTVAHQHPLLEEYIAEKRGT